MKKTVTADINANQKKLRELENKGLIEIIQIDIETPSLKTRKVLPTIVFGHTKWGRCVLGSEEGSQVFELIKKIIGKQNIKDAMHLSDHIRDKRDYFVTEDNDILSKKQQLEQCFLGLKIRTPEELLSELIN